MKCGADERRRRRLDGADPLFAPLTKMYTNLLRSAILERKYWYDACVPFLYSGTSFHLSRKRISCKITVADHIYLKRR